MPTQAVAAWRPCLAWPGEGGACGSELRGTQGKSQFLADGVRRRLCVDSSPSRAVAVLPKSLALCVDRECEVCQQDAKARREKRGAFSFLSGASPALSSCLRRISPGYLSVSGQKSK